VTITAHGYKLRVVMIYQLSVPAGIPGVEEVRILEWHREPGMAIEAGDLIVELEIQKAIIEARANQPGVLRQILAKPGDWCAIGIPLALFSTGADEDLPSDATGISAWPVQFEVT
jgi:pyruvate/2-oxoglutarate dehydrogenase complex dihydrolipoamide acyltransferase (E2) component